MTFEWQSFILGALSVLLAEGAALVFLGMCVNKGTNGSWF